MAGKLNEAVVVSKAESAYSTFLLRRQSLQVLDGECWVCPPSLLVASVRHLREGS